MHTTDKDNHMYDKREMLSALLPRALNYDYGKIDDMPDYTDVAGALGFGRLSRGADLLMKVKYLYRDECKPQLQSHTLIKLALPLAMKQDWRAGKLKNIVEAVTVEAVSDRLICPKCDGRGYIVELSQAVACTECSTLGWIGFSDEKVASMMDMPVREYQDSWKSRYKFLLGRLRSYDEEIVEALNNKWLPQTLSTGQ